MHTNEFLFNLISNFDIEGKPIDCEVIRNGHINNTYAIECVKEDGSKIKYILQQINTNVFKNPDELTENILGVCNYLQEELKKEGLDPSRRALKLFNTKDGGYLYKDSNSAWRVYNFITNATAYQSAEKPGLLYNAAKAFGNFQRQLKNYPAKSLHETIPYFHDTMHRYQDFMDSIFVNYKNRVNNCLDLIDRISRFEEYIGIIVDGLEDGSIPTRVTHNDTKLNNVMIDDDTLEGICVIDLDTVMPGSLLYDFGDSIRFAANNGLEDDPNLDNVYLRLDLFEEYTKGFLEGINGNITNKELELLPMSAFILTFELVLRFLGDYFNGDTYFKIGYEDHNLVRAKAQLKLAEDIFAKLDDMKNIVNKLK